MDNKTKLLHRLLALFVVLALLCGVSAAGLYSLQIINGVYNFSVKFMWKIIQTISKHKNINEDSQHLCC